MAGEVRSPWPWVRTSPAVTMMVVSDSKKMSTRFVENNNNNHHHHPKIGWNGKQSLKPPASPRFNAFVSDFWSYSSPSAEVAIEGPPGTGSPMKAPRNLGKSYESPEIQTGELPTIY